MVGLQTLDLAIGVRVPASQPKQSRPIAGSQMLIACLYFSGFAICAFEVV
jgi:hypothetical protein